MINNEKIEQVKKIGIYCISQSVLKKIIRIQIETLAIKQALKENYYYKDVVEKEIHKTIQEYKDNDICFVNESLERFYSESYIEKTDIETLRNNLISVSKL